MTAFQQVEIGTMSRWKAPAPLLDDGVDALGFGNPRRSLRRARGVWSLNGPWQFAVDEDLRWNSPGEVTWDATPVLLPWAPEWPRSEQFRLTPLNRTWTGRTINLPSTKNGERLVLHLEAVDYKATVYVDGEEVGGHEGGFTPFFIDMTRFSGAERMVVVRADDPLSDASTPRGKQDIKPVPSDIYYNSTTGIWRSVTLELVPAMSIVGLSWTRVTQKALDLEVTVRGDVGCTLFVECDLSLDLAGATVGLEPQRRTLATTPNPSLTVSVPIPDTLEEMITWTPDSPTVVDATVRLVDGDGFTLDEVATYTALLQWSIVPSPLGDHRMGRIALNGSLVQLRGVMNQGYYPQAGLTANREELCRTYQLIRECGLNFARVHQTVPSEEECEIALRRGILLGVEPPSPRETGAHVDE